MFQESKELTVTSAPRTGKWHELAEAIRRGIAKAPKQCFGAINRGFNATCAIGAALDGGASEWGIAEPCPVCGKGDDGGGVGPHCLALLAHLNDDHRWTRERIADWLDTL